MASTVSSSSSNNNSNSNNNNDNDKLNLRALGFCSIDDSIDPSLLAIISKKYPYVEWGVLFREDKEETPRYASKKYLEKLIQVKQSVDGQSMRLAGHLCGKSVNDVLSGNYTFAQYLSKNGFNRVQVNATAINGVDISNLGNSIPNFLNCVNAVPDLEWIVQRNNETKPLWEQLDILNTKNELPKNISFLFDASCGTGVLPSSFPPLLGNNVRCGYAGGMGPENIYDVLNGLYKVVTDAGNPPIWIDMESSLRSIVDGKDVFNVVKAFDCIQEYLRYCKKK